MIHAAASQTPDQRLELLRQDLANFIPRSLRQLEQLVQDARAERAAIGARMSALINENQKAAVPGISAKIAAVHAEMEAANATIRLRKAALAEARTALRPKLAMLLERHMHDFGPELIAAVATIEMARDLLREAERFGAFSGIELQARAYLAPDGAVLRHFLHKVTSP